MKASELIAFIEEHGLEDYEVMIQLPDECTELIELEYGELDVNDFKNILFIG